MNNTKTKTKFYSTYQLNSIERSIKYYFEYNTTNNHEYEVLSTNVFQFNYNSFNKTRQMKNKQKI